MITWTKILTEIKEAMALVIIMGGMRKVWEKEVSSRDDFDKANPSD